MTVTKQIVFITKQKTFRTKIECLYLKIINNTRNYSSNNNYINNLNRLKMSSNNGEINSLNNNNNNRIKINDIAILNRENCKIKNPEKVECILNELINGGTQKLQIVSDFDFTITKKKLENGKPVLSSFCVMDVCCKTFPADYVTESQRLIKKYHPIEIDPHIEIKDKIESMVEWWTYSSKLLTGFPFNLSQIDEVTKDYSHALRDGACDLFNEVNNYNIPVLVFSAGLGDCIISMLKQANVFLPNIKVISNFLRFENGILNGFDVDKMIHVFNKNETVLKDTEYYDLVHERDHIILMGDSLGDACMANGVPTTSYILKIGFLSDHIEKNLPNYMNAFDIVLLEDETMDIPRAIFSLISEKKEIK